MISAPQADNTNHIRSCVGGISNVGEISVHDLYASVGCKGYELVDCRYNKVTKEIDVEFLNSVENFGAILHPGLTITKTLALISTGTITLRIKDYRLCA